MRTSKSHRIVLQLADGQPEDASTVRCHTEVRHCEFFIHPEAQDEKYLWADCERVSVQQAHIYSNFFLFVLLWRCDPTRVMASSFLRFLDHTQRRTTVGRTPLDERSVRRRDLYLTTLTTDKHPCRRWDSHPRSQQASGRRPTP